MASKESDATAVQEASAAPTGHARYYGAKTLVLLQSVNLIYFTQLVNIVGSGVLTRDVAAVVGGSSDSIWYTQTIAIMTVVLTIPVTQAADFWGRKIFLVTFTSFGCVGAIIVSRATTSTMAIAGFAITGISYGAQALLHAVTSEIVARKHRAWAQASINVSAAVGGILGLLMGGGLTRNGQHDGFRVYWYVVAGLYAFTAVTCQLLYNPPTRELQTLLTTREKLARLDWTGYLFLSPALVLLCVGLVWSDNPYPWSDPRVSATFATGVALAIVLAIYEVFFKKDGMFHHALFAHRNFTLALGCILGEGFVFFCANNFFAFEVSVLFSTDSLQTGAHYSINFVGLAISSVLGGLWCSKARQVRLPSVVAFGLFTIFTVLMATVTSNTSKSQIWAYPIFLGCGLGICLTALVTAAQLVTPRELIAVTSGLLIAMRSLGGSIGLAVYNAIFSASLSANLGTKIAQAVIPLGFPADGLARLIPALVAHDDSSLADVPGVTREIVLAGYEALQAAYLVSFRHVWIAAGSVAFVSMIASIFLIDPTSEFNSDIDAPVVLEAELDRGTLKAEEAGHVGGAEHHA